MPGFETFKSAEQQLRLYKGSGKQRQCQKIASHWHFSKAAVNALI